MDYAGNSEKTREVYASYLSQAGNRLAARAGRLVAQGKEIDPAKCVGLQSELDRLYEQRKRLYVDYKILESRILYGPNEGALRRNYENLLSSIESTQAAIDAIHEYYESGCERTDEAIESRDAAAAAEQRRLRALREKGEKSEYVKRIAALIAIESRELAREPDYLVLSPPVERDAPIAPRKPEPEPEPEPKRRAKKPAAAARLSTNAAAEVKDRIKDLIKQKLKPKNFEECSSKKRSDPSYMRLEDMHKAIDESPEIKLSLPSNYKSLTKEHLCKHLYP